MVLDASACAFASLAGKLWLLSLRSVAPSPTKALKGGKEFGLRNVNRLSVTSTCFLYVSWALTVKQAAQNLLLVLHSPTALFVHIFQQFNTRKATDNPFKLRMN